MALVIGLGQSVQGAGPPQKPNYRPQDCCAQCKCTKFLTGRSIHFQLMSAGCLVNETLL